MAALMRCVFPKHANFGQAVLRRISASNRYGRSIPTAQRYASYTKAEPKEQILREVRNKIDHNLGISRNLFHQLYSSCEQSGETTEQDIAALLYICSNGPFDSSSQRRADLATQVWGNLDHMGVVPSTKLYNIKLKVYTSNKIPFSPLDELKQMKSLGLIPDRITFGLLVEGFCQKGDIAGANSVLEAMKCADYSLGSEIFDSFITGHLKAGSPEEARKVLEVMKSRGIDPMSETYLRFAVHYAEVGDIDLVLKYINEAEANQIMLHHTALLDLYQALVTSGHSAQTGQILKMIAERGTYQKISLQKSCQLVSEGFCQEAFTLHQITPLVNDEKSVPKSGSFLLKAMIINGQNADAVMDMADKIVENSPKSLPHRHALYYMYTDYKTDYAMQFLKLLKSKGDEILVPYIIPAICQYRDTQNREGLHQAVQMLLELEGEQILNDKLEMIHTFAYPALIAVGETQEEIIQHFKDFEKLWNFIFFIEDLKKGHSTALENVSGKEVDWSLCVWFGFSGHLKQHLPKNWREYIDVLTHIKEQGAPTGLLMSLAYKLIAMGGLHSDWGNVENVIAALSEKGLRVKRNVKETMFYQQAPQNIQQKLDELHYEKLPSRQALVHDMEKLEAMSREQLEDYQRNNPKLHIPQIVLLNRAIKANDLAEVQLRLQELTSRQFKFSVNQLKVIVNALTRMEDVEGAINYFTEMRKSAGTNYQDVLALNIAAQQVKAKDVVGAMEMIAAASESTFHKDELSQAHRIRALITILMKAPNVEDATNLHAEIFKSWSLVPESDAIQVHAAYVRRVMADDDNESLLSRLKSLHESHKVLPILDRVLVRLIEKQDVDRLKQVMELGIKMFGSNVFHHKLAMAFVECGMSSRAVSVLLTPGLKIKEKDIVTGCRHFLKMKRIDCLESLSNITKDLPVSRAVMLTYLLEGYAAVDKLDKASEVLDHLTESVIKLPQATAQLLAKAYRSKNMEVPQVLRAMVSNTQEHVKKVSETKESDKMKDSGNVMKGDETKNDDELSSSGSESDSEASSSPSSPSSSSDEENKPTADPEQQLSSRQTSQLKQTK